jgi:DNA-binding MarR family transcriptional regulator
MDRGREDREGRAPAASLVEISRVLDETARLIRDHARAEALAGGIEDTSLVPNELEGHGYRPESDPTRVRAILALRMLRREYLGHDLSDPAWAMMLELYAARLEGRLVNQTRLGLDTGVPQTTALATVRRLVGAGIFEAGDHPTDKRLIVLTLASDAAARLARYLAAAHRIAPVAA